MQPRSYSQPHYQTDQPKGPMQPSLEDHLMVPKPAHEKVQHCYDSSLGLEKERHIKTGVWIVIILCKYFASTPLSVYKARSLDKLPGIIPSIIGI